MIISNKISIHCINACFNGIFNFAPTSSYFTFVKKKVSVLTDWVYSENDDIDVDAAEEALKRAKEALENVTEEDIEVAKDLEQVISKSMAQITVKTRSKAK